MCGWLDCVGGVVGLCVWVVIVCERVVVGGWLGRIEGDNEPVVPPLASHTWCLQAACFATLQHSLRPAAASPRPCSAHSPKQVMPQLLNYLEQDPSDPASPDWGTIAVYTCSRSCSSGDSSSGGGGAAGAEPHSAYMEEFVWVQSS